MKKLLNMIIDFFELRIDKSMFDINREELQKANMLLLKQISAIGGSVTLIMCGLSFVVPHFYGLSMEFLLFFAASLIMFGLTCLEYQTLNGYIYPMIYFYMGLALTFCILLDTYLDPGGQAVISVIVLALTPMFILDKQTHVLALTALAWAALCIASTALKDFSYAGLDILNATIAVALGASLNTRIFKSRLSNLNNTRLLALQVEADALTGLPNYKKLMDDLSGEHDSRIAKSLCSLAVIDIDWFMEYNSKYGREMGDKCLKKIGNCMRRISDPSELIIYRYGGTSLVAVSLIHDYEGIRRVCRGISSLIRDLEIEHRGTPQGIITVSCGYTDVVECGCDEYKKLIDMAQTALKQAKKEGGNTSIGYLQTLTAI